MSLAQTIWLIFLNTLLVGYNIGMQVNNKDSKGIQCFGRGFCSHLYHKKNHRAYTKA